MYIKLEKKKQIMFALFKELNFIKPLSTLYTIVSVYIKFIPNKSS